MTPTTTYNIRNADNSPRNTLSTTWFRDPCVAVTIMRAEFTRCVCLTRIGCGYLPVVAPGARRGMKATIRTHASTSKPATT
jgi:hypothetical protein